MERLWRCDCRANHFIALVYYEDDHGHTEEGYFSVIEESKGNEPFLSRLKAAVGILFGRDHVWSSVTLDAETATELSAAAAHLAHKIKASPR